MYLKNILRIILVFAGVALCGCGGFESAGPEVVSPSVDVVFAVGNVPGTRTEYDSEAKRFVWNDVDELAVWAKSSAGTFALENQTFRLLASGAGRQQDGESGKELTVVPDKSSAYFTSTLSSPMEKGTYSYYMTYPLPESVSGTTATFTVPAVQDGLASSGVDVLVAEPASGTELSAVGLGVPVDDDKLLRVRMKHLLHFFRFYIPEGSNSLGGPVTGIELTMPKPIVGSISVDATDASTARLTGGANTLSLDLKNPIDASIDGSQVALAGIFPPGNEYSLDDVMNITVLSENMWEELPPVSLTGRSFEPGHVTPVPLRPLAPRSYYTLKFTLDSNNLGEDPQSISLALPDGDNWPRTSSNVLTFKGENGALIKVGDSFFMKTHDEAAFRALSSKQVAVRYESESAIVSETVTIGDLSSVTSADCALNCPYLFFEDFSGVEGFSSHDEFSKGTQVGTNFGNYDAYTFLDGWSAARAGAQTCTAIRLSCRREALNDYSARADSPSLSCIKDGKMVNLSVQFDYSMNREEYAFLTSKPNAKQTVYCGFISTFDNLGSNSKIGTFPESFDVDETTGSYSNIDKHKEIILNGVETPIRLSWRTIPEHVVGSASSSTCWLYIDNIKVKIKK